MTKQSNMPESQMLKSQEHLEAILFQFVNLYERFSEDRQVGVKQSSDTAKLVSSFMDQVNRFETLTPAVCDALSSALKKMISNAVHEVSQEINGAAFRATENIAQHLKSAASDTEQTLLRANSGVPYTKRKNVTRNLEGPGLPTLRPGATLKF